MSENRGRKLLAELDKLALIASGVGIVVLAAAYFVTGHLTNIPSTVRDFIQSIITNLIPVLIIFAISYALFRRIQIVRSEQETEDLAGTIASEIKTSLRREPPAGSPADSTYYDEFGLVPWHELLSTCSTVDICVHYFDTWINLHSKLLQQLFDRGGVIRLVLPNHRNEHLVRIIKQRFPDYNEDQLRTKIEYSHTKLALLLEKAVHRDARIETYYVDDMIWYCGIRFDRRVLVLSVYEHMREMRVAAPALLVSLGKFEATQIWFEKEFQGLMNKSVDKNILDGRQRRH